MNQFFKQQFGYPYRNGVFAIGNENVASEYGPVHQMFPIGPFEFVWSPNIENLYMDIIDDPYLSSYFHQTGSEYDKQVYEKKHIFKKLQNAGYQNSQLKQAIKSDNEIMLRLHKYHTISLSTTAFYNYKTNKFKAGPSMSKSELQQIQDELINRK